MFRNGWKQDGWSAFVVVDRGRSFDFLTWYRPLVMSTALPEKPTVTELRGGLPWNLRTPGTISRVHFNRMELEKVATLSVDQDKLARSFPIMRPGHFEAINDVSISNVVNTRATTLPVIFGSGDATITGIDSVLR